MECFYRPRLKPALEIKSASISPSSRTTSAVSQIPISSHLICLSLLRIESAIIFVKIWGNCSVEGLAEVVGSSGSVHLEGFSGTEDLNKVKKRAGLVATVLRDN
jgi:hypothetical protein